MPLLLLKCHSLKCLVISEGPFSNYMVLIGGIPIVAAIEIVSTIPMQGQRMVTLWQIRGKLRRAYQCAKMLAAAWPAGGYKLLQPNDWATPPLPVLHHRARPGLSLGLNTMPLLAVWSFILVWLSISTKPGLVSWGSYLKVAQHHRTKLQMVSSWVNSGVLTYRSYHKNTFYSNCLPYARSDKLPVSLA